VEKITSAGTVTVANDWDPETLYFWKRDGIANSKITIKWDTTNAAPGMYRIRHYGHWKSVNYLPRSKMKSWLILVGAKVPVLDPVAAAPEAEGPLLMMRGVLRRRPPTRDGPMSIVAATAEIEVVVIAVWIAVAEVAARLEAAAVVAAAAVAAAVDTAVGPRLDAMIAAFTVT